MSGRQITDDAVPSHPLLQGLVELGRGESCIVLDKGDGERVYKLVGCPAAYALYTDPERPSGPHYPIVYADHGIVGRGSNGYPLHLLEMEKLYPLPEGSEVAQMAARITTTFFESCRMWSSFAENMSLLALQGMIRVPARFPADIQEALGRLYRFAEDFQVLPDLINKGNLMMRRDGTLVFSDPVFLG